jgi:hypothetical protein
MTNAGNAFVPDGYLPPAAVSRFFGFASRMTDWGLLKDNKVKSVWNNIE